MDLRAKLTLLGLFALLGAFVGNIIGWGWVGLLWLFIALSTASAIAIESPKYRPALRKLFLPRRAGTLYRRLLWKPAHWPRDWRMYDKALLIALVYPILLPVVIWVWNGQAVMLGDLPLLAQEARGSIRLMVAIAFSMAAISFPCAVWLGNRGETASSGQESVQQIVFWVIRFSLGLALALTASVAIGYATGFSFGGTSKSNLAVISVFAYVFAAVFTGPNAGTGVFAFTGALTVAAVGLSGSSAVLLAGAGLLFLAFGLRRVGWRNVTYFPIPVLFLGFTSVALSKLGAETAAQQNYPQLLLFLGFLPLTNALFDYASYALTFGLMRDGMRGGVIKRLAFAALDLASAFALFYLLGLALVLVLWAANLAHGGPLYPLAQMFDDIRAHPEGHWWLFGMLFATLLSTLLHGFLASFSIGGLVVPRWRAKLCAGIASDDPVEQVATMFGIGAYATLSLVLPFGLLWGLYQTFLLVTPYPFLWYLDAVQDFARAIGALG